MSFTLDNENLPANHQDIDNIPNDEDHYDPEELASVVLNDPMNVTLLDKAQLAFAYEALDAKMEEIESAKSVVKDTIFSLMDTDSEEVGNYLALKVTKPVFKTLTIEQAKELGLTKVEEKIDHNLVKRAWKAGAKVGEVEFDVMNVMRKKKSENVEEVL